MPAADDSQSRLCFVQLEEYTAPVSLDVPSRPRRSMTFAHFFLHLTIVCVEFSSFVTLDRLEMLMLCLRGMNLLCALTFCLSKADTNNRY